jgi:group I intron endonuclease
MIIYKIQNKIDGKIYIGQTKKQLSRRIAEHILFDSYIGKALRKYGIQSFEISVIDEAADRETLNDKELFWICFYDCKYPNGYNFTDGGDGIEGYKHTEAAILKIKEKRALQVMGKEQYLKHVEYLRSHPPFKGKKHSDESKEKNRKAHVGKSVWNKGLVGYSSDDTKQKYRKSRLGKSIPAISKALKGKPWSAARRAAQNKKGKGE